MFTSIIIQTYEQHTFVNNKDKHDACHGFYRACNCNSTKSLALIWCHSCSFSTVVIVMSHNIEGVLVCGDA